MTQLKLHNLLATMKRVKQKNSSEIRNCLQLKRLQCAVHLMQHAPNDSHRRAQVHYIIGARKHSLILVAMARTSSSTFSIEPLMTLYVCEGREKEKEENHILGV